MQTQKPLKFAYPQKGTETCTICIQVDPWTAYRNARYLGVLTILR